MWTVCNEMLGQMELFLILCEKRIHIGKTIYFLIALYMEYICGHFLLPR